MELKLENRFKDFIQQLEEFLDNRKNLMIYDDYKDSSLNEAYRFLYSNPGDPLEFICVDIYTNSKHYGVISVVTSRKKSMQKSFLTIYGEVISESIVVRDVEKTRVSLVLNEKGYEDIEKSIVYFETKLISKN